jgi:hypothetical protein
VPPRDEHVELARDGDERRDAFLAQRFAGFEGVVQVVLERRDFVDEPVVQAPEEYFRRVAVPHAVHVDREGERAGVAEGAGRGGEFAGVLEFRPRGHGEGEFGADLAFGFEAGPVEALLQVLWVGHALGAGAGGGMAGSRGWRGRGLVAFEEVDGLPGDAGAVEELVRRHGVEGVEFPEAVSTSQKKKKGNGEIRGRSARAYPARPRHCTARMEASDMMNPNRFTAILQ